jgi:hypothetical protein
MYDPSTRTTVSSSGDSSSRSARYAYLIGRLRTRQITMEEATELFGVMQGMLQRSEAARQAAVGATGGPDLPPPPPRSSTTPPVPSAPGAPGTISDDSILLGLLALGAGAGLVTAVTKRFQETAGAGRPVKPATGSQSS